MYIHKTLIYHIILNQFTHSKWEFQTIKLPSCGQTKYIILINIYRPQNNLTADYKQFIDEFSALLTLFDSTSYEIIITGDFNINLLEKNILSVFF